VNLKNEIINLTESKSTMIDDIRDKISGNKDYGNTEDLRKIADLKNRTFYLHIFLSSFYNNPEECAIVISISVGNDRHNSSSFLNQKDITELITKTSILIEKFMHVDVKRKIINSKENRNAGEIKKYRKIAGIAVPAITESTFGNTLRNDHYDDKLHPSLKPSMINDVIDGAINRICNMDNISVKKSIKNNYNLYTLTPPFEIFPNAPQ
jgi:hypothetical protein